MTVQCPECRTQYRVPEDRLSKGRPTFRCSRCDRVFSFEKERPIRSAAKGATQKQNLSFDFSAERPAPTIHSTKAAVAEEPDDSSEEDEEEEEQEEEESEEDDEEEEEEEHAEEPGPPEPAFVGGMAPAATAPAPTRKARPEPAPPPKKKPAPRPSRRVEREEDEDEAEEEKAPLIIAAQNRKRPPPIQPRAPAPRTDARRSPLRPIGIAVAAIAVIYLLVAVSLDRHPALALDQLSRVPVLGQLLGQDHLLAWRLEVTDLDGGLDYIRDNRLSYVVSGRAINTTGQDLRIIEVEGSLVADGKPQRRQRVYAANQARSTIRDLSPSEVEMLLRLEPNRRFVIHPGESATFLLVFPNPPTGFNEISVRVVDARTP